VLSRTPGETDYRKELRVDSELVGSTDLEKLTGTKASTWRYWASIGTGPASFKLGRRRVWRKSVALAWLAEQEAATVRGWVA
jgi:predicted DNA-binding transcriptional regulator AlpA